MSLYEALTLLIKNVSGRIPIGYWERNGEYIFNTKAAPMTEGLAAPAQYVVTKSGEVYGTNPIQSNIDPAKMKKLPRFGKK